MSEALGSAAQEAIRLLTTAQGWAQERRDDPHLATGSPECSTCPVCRVVVVLRQVTPEAVEQVVDAATSFVSAVKAAFRVPAEPDGTPP